MIYGAGNDFKHKVIVTFNEQKAREIYEEYRFFDKYVRYFPPKDILFYQSAKLRIESISSPHSSIRPGLSAPLKELGEYEEIVKGLAAADGKVSISGCVDTQKLHMVFGLGAGEICRLY